jgi:hypothetical protein
MPYTDATERNETRLALRLEREPELVRTLGPINALAVTPDADTPTFRAVRLTKLRDNPSEEKTLRGTLFTSTPFTLNSLVRSVFRERDQIKPCHVTRW